MSCSVMAAASTRAFGARSAAVVTGRSALRLGALAMMFTSLLSTARRHTNTNVVPPCVASRCDRLAQTGSRPERLPLGENGRRCGCCRGLRRLPTPPYASLREESTTICRRPMTDAGNFRPATGKIRNQVTRPPRRSLGDHEIPETGVLPSRNPRMAHRLPRDFVRPGGWSAMVTATRRASRPDRSDGRQATMLDNVRRHFHHAPD
jgi:hypothetical protein